MDERDPRVEVGPQPVDQRQGERDLRHEHERRPAALEGCARSPRRRSRSCRRRSRRRAGAGAGRRPAIAATIRSTASAWAGQEVARGGPAAAPAGGSGRERPARALADLGLDQAAPDEPGGRRRSVAGRQIGRRQFAGRCRRELRQERRPGAARGAGPGPAPRPPAHQPPTVPASSEPDPALVARPGARPEQRPVEVDPALAPRAPAAAQQPGPAVGPGQVADRSRAAHELVEQVRGGTSIGGIGPPAVPRLRPTRRARLRAAGSARRRAPAARAARAAASPAARAPAARGSGRRSTAPARGSAAAGAARRRGPDRRRLRRRPRASSVASARTIPSACRRPNSTRTASPGTRSASASGTRYVYVRSPPRPAASTATSTARRPPARRPGSGRRRLRRHGVGSRVKATGRRPRPAGRGGERARRR